MCVQVRGCVDISLFMTNDCCRPKTTTPDSRKNRRRTKSTLIPNIRANSSKYPRTVTPARTDASTGTLRAMKNGFVRAFSAGAFLYVGVEAAISVWMPTLMAGYTVLR